MADVSGKFFSAVKVRTGVSPSSPGSLVGEPLEPVNPPGAGLSSVGITMPSAFAVANSPLTSNGTIQITGAGTIAQYVRGDGTLETFPSLTGFVPYTGATQNVDLGEFGIDAGFVQLDTTPTNTPTTQGTIFWDGDDETIAVILNGYIMKIGEDQFYPVKNQTGSSIAKGTAVRFAGTLGASGRLLIAPFIADGSVSSSFFMGVTAEAIANGADGKVLYFGRIRGINTNAFNEGDVLYASTTVAGGFQTAVPVAPNNIVQVAAVINKSINQGVIFIRPSFGSNINQDEGVKIVSPTTGQLLQLQANGLWENKTTAQVLGGTSSQFVKGDGTLDSNTYQVTSEKGQPNGYASLDSNGKVPLVQINDALIGNVNFQGLWNAATNTPTLANPPASGTKGHYYIVSTAGTFASISFEVGDWIISDGTAWGKVDNTDAVSSVFGRTGNVVASNGDYTTAQVTESGNLYYTDGRARGALSFVAGSGAYDSSTGVITIPTNNNQITNGAGYITSAALGGYVQGSASAGQVAYWSSGSAITGESNLFWDATNDRLGINNATPLFSLDVNGTGRFSNSVGGRIVTIDGPSNTDNFLSLFSGSIEMFIDADFTNSAGIVGTQSIHNLILRTAGTNKIWIDTSGNLGVGQNNPSFKLDVNGTGRFSSILQANGVFRQFVIAGYYADFGYNGTTYNFGSGEATDNVDYKISGGGTFTSGGNFRWFTQTGGATPVERFKIASTGAATFSSSVSVNGAAATTSFNVQGSGANGILLDQNSADATSSSRLFFKMNTQTYAMLADSNGLNFSSGATAGSSSGSTKLIISSGGNVGINQTNPAARLEVVPQDANGNEGIFVNQLGSRQSTIRFKSAHSEDSDFRVGASITVASSFEIYSIAAASSRLIITPGGNILIGTTDNAGFRLDVNGTGRFSGTITSSVGNNSQILTSASATTGYQFLDIVNTSGRLVIAQEGSTAGTVFTGTTAYASLIGTAVSRDFQIGTNNTIRLTIAAATGAATFSSTNLTLQSSTEAEVRSLSTSTGNYANFIVDTNNNTDYRLQMVGFGTAASGTLAGISRAGNGFLVKSGGLLAVGTRDSNDLVLSTNDAQRMRITSGGNVLIGTTTEGVGRLQVNGTGRFIGNENSLIQQAATVNADVYYEFRNSAGSRRAYFGFGGASSSVFDLWNSENGDMKFGTNNTLRLTIASTGAATFSNLSGSGNRIVVANSGGTLISAVIGSGLAFDGTTLTATGGASGSISGSGTSGIIPVFTGTSSIGNSVITQSSGNIGINQSNPTGRLEVVPASAGGNEGIFVNQLSSNQSTIRFKSAHDANSDYRIGASILIGSAFEIFSVNAAATRFAVTSGGNVLIGTTTDNGHKLQLSSASTSKTTFSINNTSANKTYEIGVQGSSGTLPNRFYIFDDDRNAFLFTITSGGTSRFHAALETIELTSESTTKLATINGNVMIGTTTDNGTKLQVNGAIITSNPSGDTARPFKVGGVNNESDKSFAGNILKVEVNGVIYRLMIAE